jgi:hypothetical protein
MGIESAVHPSSKEEFFNKISPYSPMLDVA